MEEKIKEKSSFDKLYEINVNEHTEKKGRFTYLSWAFAVAELKKAFPDATWGVYKAQNESPFFETSCGYFVHAWVEVEGLVLEQIHPVLDNRNRPIEKPNAFEINTSIQRAITKAIGLHGLGLYIYAGEDLPEVEESANGKTKSQRSSSGANEKVDMNKLAEDLAGF